MIANKWYCIAQTGTFDSGCTINVSFDSYVIQFSASVKYGSSAINITRCELPLSANLSLRLRESNGLWSVDLLSNNDITPEIVVADSPYWVAVNSIAGAGNIILTLKDISKDFNTETGGSGGGLDENALRDFLDKYGYTRAKDFWKYETTGGGAIHTDYHIIVDGGGAFGGAELGGGGESGGGGISEFYIQLGEGGQKYKLGNSGLPNVVQIPKYPVVPTNVSEFYNDAGYIGGEQAALIFSRISEVEARVEKLEKLWWVDENGNLHTTYNIVVEKGGAFGTGASVDTGGSGGLGRVVLVNDSGDEYASDENGIVRIPDYINKIWFDAQKFATQSWVLSKGYVSESVLAPIREDITALKGDVAELKSMWTIKDGKLYTTYSIVVKGGGSFGEGSESGGGSTGGLGQITIRNQAGQEYKTDANGVVIIPTYLTSNALDGYATQQWVESKKYLTSVPTEYITETELASKGYAVASEIAKTYATIESLNTTNTNLATVTAGLANVVTTVNALSKNFVNGVSKEAAKVSHALTFGSKTYDGSIARTILASDLDAVTLSGEQIITGAKTFGSLITANGGIKIPHTASLKIGDITLVEENGALKILGNLVVTGGGAFGTGSTSGGGTSGGLGSVTIRTEGGIEYKSNSNGVVTVPNWITASALNGYATEAWVNNKLTKANIKATLGIADWALAASKPSYSWSEITGKPSFATVATSGKYSDISGVPTSLPASDVYAWAKAATKPTYTASEVGALSLTGGTITSTSVFPLTVNSTYNGESLILIQNNGSAKVGIGWMSDSRYGTYIYSYAANKYLGIKDDGTPHFHGQTLLHSGNYSSYALPLSGGTITGLTTIKRDAVTPFEIENTAGTNSLSQVVLRYRYNGSYISGIGAKTDGYLYRYDSTLSNAYKIWDTGNFNPANYLPLGGGTLTGNLSAPLYLFGNGGGTYLDSGASGEFVFYDLSARRIVLHSGNYSSYALPLSGGTLTGDLVLGWHSSAGSKSIAFTAESGGNKAYLYADAYDLKYLFNNQYNTLIHSGNIGSYSMVYDKSVISGSSAYASSSKFNTIGYGNATVDSGWKTYGPILTFGIDAYHAQLQKVYNSDTLYIRSWINGAYTDWKTIAFTDSNVASATKLQTARTIWGQSFDGTGNVDGQFSLGGYLRMHSNSGELWLNYGGANDAYDLNVCGYVTRFYYGVASSYNSAMIINHTGNILMGTATDSAQGEKLQVSGSILCDNIQQYDSQNGYFIGARKVGLGSTDGGALIYSYGDNPISLWTNYTERIKILGNGNVLIGDTTDSGSKLSIYANGASGRIKIYSSGTEGLNIGQWDGVTNRFESYGRPMLFTAYDAKPIMFGFSGNGNALTLNPNGNVLIGTTTDSGDKLRINGAVRAAGHIRLDRYHGASEYLQLEAEDVNINYRAYDTDGWCSHNFYSNDNLLVRIDGYAGKLDINGNLVVTGGGAFGSDVRYKHIINYTNIDLTTIADAPLFTYQWNDREDKKVYLGTSAQYWLNTAFTNAVNTDNPNFFHLDYGALGVGLAIVTARKVVDHEERIATLEKENKELKKKLNKYETLWHN